MKRTLAACCMLAVILVATIGCRHTVQSTNPAVIQAATLNDAEKIVSTVAHGLLAARQTLDSLEATEPDYYRAVLPKIQVLAKLNEKANQCILADLSGGVCDWQQAVAQIAQGVSDPTALTAFGFKNPKSQQIVQLGFAGLLAGINLAVEFRQRTQSRTWMDLGSLPHSSAVVIWGGAL